MLELRTKADEIYSLLSDLGSGKAPKAQAEEGIATNLAKKPKDLRQGSEYAVEEEDRRKGQDR